MPSRRTYPGGLRCQLIVLGILLTIASLVHSFSSSYVQQNHVYTQAAAQGSSFTALSASDVPFYKAGGFPMVPGSQTQVYCFNWFVFATDSLRPFLLVYSLVAALLAVLIPLDSLGALFYQPVVILILLVELAKVIYFALYLLNLFGLNCAEFAFCRNRNPAITATPDASFIVAISVAGFFAVVCGALTTLPGVVRKAHLASDPIGSAFSGSDEDEMPLAGSLRTFDSPLTYKTRKRSTTHVSSTAQAESGVALIRDFTAP